MTSAFFSTFTQISMEHVTSVAQTVSQSGVRQAQRRSPVFYKFTVSYPIMDRNGTNHVALRNAIIQNQYNYLTFTTTIPSSTGLLTSRGSFDARSGTNPRADSNQSGYSIVIDSWERNRAGITMIGDFIQFDNWTKVLQVTTDSNSNADGDITVGINSSYPLSTGRPQIRTGHDVIFTLMVEKRPEPTFIQGHLVQYSNGVFREVL